MSKLNSKFRYMYDAAPAAALRARDAAALTATGVAGSLDLDQLGGYWNTDGELADQTLAVVVNVTALDAVNGTYDLDLEAGPAGFASAKVVGTLKGITAAGQYVILLDMGTVKALKDDAAAIRLSLTATDVDGAGVNVPSITFHSWIAPVQA